MESTRPSDPLPSSTGVFYALRLLPGQDLKAELERFAAAQSFQALAIVTCVGSLQATTLRLAGQEQGTAYPGKQEIVSLVGTLSQQGVHLHLSVANSQGQLVGGHLLPGCIIYTTAEVVLVAMPALRFLRSPDATTGYKELEVHPFP